MQVRGWRRASTQSEGAGHPEGYLGPSWYGVGTFLDRTFLDLGYFIRHQTMRRAVYGLSRFLVRSFGKAEDLARLLVEPVPKVLDPVLVLDLFVLSVGVCDRFSGQPHHVLVVVHE